MMNIIFSANRGCDSYIAANVTCRRMSKARGLFTENQLDEKLKKISLSGVDQVLLFESGQRNLEL